MVPTEASELFAKDLRLSPKSLREVLATAEHLHARCDGGSDTEANIAAAHFFCNARRHRMRPAPPPDKYKALVQTELQKGCWLKKVLRQRLEAARERLS